MSRSEYLAQFFRNDFGKRPARTREKREPAPERTWAFDVPGHGQQTVTAQSKSEARSLLKKRLRLERLPRGTALSRAA